jgi:hypothetical protein
MAGPPRIMTGGSGLFVLSASIVTIDVELCVCFYEFNGLVPFTVDPQASLHNCLRPWPLLMVLATSQGQFLFKSGKTNV